MLFRKRQLSKQQPAYAVRLQIDSALEYRSVDQRAEPSVIHTDFGTRVEFDYVPIKVKHQRYYLTSLWLPDERGYINSEAVDAAGEYHRFPWLTMDDLPCEITDVVDGLTNTL